MIQLLQRELTLKLTIHEGVACLYRSYGVTLDGILCVEQFVFISRPNNPVYGLGGMSCMATTLCAPAVTQLAPQHSLGVNERLVFTLY